MSPALPVVLVHGGGFDARCWDRLVPHLDSPAIAVDLPGRGAHPADLRSVTLDDCARSIAADVDAAGYDEVVLVAHSLGGCSMPGAIGLLGDRVRHAVFVACTVPEDGGSVIDTLEPELQAMSRDSLGQEPAAMGVDLARLLFGNDLDDEQLAWCVERCVPEAPRLVGDPVDLAPLRSAMPRTWVRTMRDAVVAADKQLRFARNAGVDDVVDLDAAHMGMISRPVELARLLDGIAATAR